MAITDIFEYKSYRNDLTAEYIRSILDYNQETGIFTWKYRCSATPQWNGQWAGKIAGTPHKGYIRIFINKRCYHAHRLVWLYITGKWPREEIDHRNTIKNDNKFINLREATKLQNAKNSLKKSNNKSGYKGIYFKKVGNWERYGAKIGFNNKKLHLGYFATKEKAYAVYCKAAERFHKDFGNIK